MIVPVQFTFALTAYCWGAALFLIAAMLFAPIGIIPCPVFEPFADWLCPRMDTLHVELFGVEDDD